VLNDGADVLRLYPDPDATALKQAIAVQQNVMLPKYLSAMVQMKFWRTFLRHFSCRISRFYRLIFHIVFIQFIASFLRSTPKLCH